MNSSSSPSMSNNNTTNVTLLPINTRFVEMCKSPAAVVTYACTKLSFIHQSQLPAIPTLSLSDTTGAVATQKIVLAFVKLLYQAKDVQTVPLRFVLIYLYRLSVLDLQNEIQGNHQSFEIKSKFLQRELEVVSYLLQHRALWVYRYIARTQIIFGEVSFRTTQALDRFIQLLRPVYLAQTAVIALDTSTLKDGFRHFNRHRTFSFEQQFTTATTPPPLTVSTTATIIIAPPPPSKRPRIIDKESKSTTTVPVQSNLYGDLEFAAHILKHKKQWRCPKFPLKEYEDMYCSECIMSTPSDDAGRSAAGIHPVTCSECHTKQHSHCAQRFGCESTMINDVETFHSPHSSVYTCFHCTTHPGWFTHLHQPGLVWPKKSIRRNATTPIITNTADAIPTIPVIPPDNNVVIAKVSEQSQQAEKLSSEIHHHQTMQHLVKSGESLMLEIQRLLQENRILKSTIESKNQEIIQLTFRNRLSSLFDDVE